MITKITAKGFKGWSGTQDLSEHTLFIGDNGKGKSARSQALQLAINGYVIGAGKKNEEILSSFGEGDKLVVGAEIDGTLFERGFVRTASGSVSQGFKVNGVKAAKDFFMKALGEVGTPVILNVSDFMALSNQKKIEALFALYPPAGDVGSVQAKIDQTKERINTLNQKIRSMEEAAARIAASKAAITVPAGTLAEIDAEIKNLEEQLGAARNDLMEAKIAEQKAEDERKAKEEASRKEREQPKSEETKAAETDPPPSNPPVQEPKEPDPMEKEVDRKFGRVEERLPVNEFGGVFSLTTEEISSTIAAKKLEMSNSILAIINSLNTAGCSACAAKLVAQRELKKYQEVANGNR